MIRLGFSPNSRKLFSSIALFLALFLMTSYIPVAANAATAGRYIVYVGAYTDHGGKGIYAYHFDPATGGLEAMGLQAEAANPSWVTVSSNQKYLYAVSEIGDYQGKKSGGVLAYQLDKSSAKLSLLNEVASMGAGPCHLSIDKTGKFVMVANYDSGSVAVFPIHSDGGLGEASAFVQHSGSGTDPKRQEGPHAHFIETSPDNSYALAADLGLDEVLVSHFDAQKGALTPNDPPYAKVRGGSGPRHFTFHPNGHYLYLLSEMASTVTVFAYDPAAGTLKEKQTISALPKSFSGPSDAAEIQIDAAGKFLYASNRGSDSITVFAVNGQKGTLRVVQNISSGGKTPRYFTLDPTGRFLLAANQESDNIVTFTVDRRSGKLAKVSQVEKISAPVCLSFVAID